jgi:hypothetical protein
MQQPKPLPTYQSLDTDDPKKRLLIGIKDFCLIVRQKAGTILTGDLMNTFMEFLERVEDIERVHFTPNLASGQVETDYRELSRNMRGLIESCQVWLNTFGAAATLIQAVMQEMNQIRMYTQKEILSEQPEDLVPKVSIFGPSAPHCEGGCEQDPKAISV